MDFLNPEYYDIKTISPDCPNKPLLIELYKAMNEQNERLWMFFEDIDSDPGHVAMKLAFIKPRQHRASFNKRKKEAEALRAERAKEQEEDSEGYKQFLRDEGFDDLLTPQDREHTKAQRDGYARRGRVFGLNQTA